MKPVSLEALLARDHHYHPDTYPELVSYDEYPSLQPEDGQALRMVLDRLLDDLPTEQGRAVELTIVAGLPYRRAAAELGYRNARTGEPDGKKAWRQSRRGLAKIRRQLEGNWQQAIVGHRLP